MSEKKLKICVLCSKEEMKNRKGNHHIIPRKYGGAGLKNNRVWLCSHCHAFLHTAEQVGLCKLPTRRGSQ